MLYEDEIVVRKAIKPDMRNHFKILMEQPINIQPLDDVFRIHKNLFKIIIALIKCT